MTKYCKQKKTGLNPKIQKMVSQKTSLRKREISKTIIREDNFLYKREETVNKKEARVNGLRKQIKKPSKLINNSALGSKWREKH